MGEEWNFPLDKEMFIKAWISTLGSNVGKMDREFVSVIAELLNQAYLRGVEDAQRSA